MCEYGGADLGVPGKDTLIEHGGQGLYQPLDLQHRQVPRQRGRARLTSTTPRPYVRQGSRLRVATKYVGIAREFFAAKGVHVDLIKLYGSMELAPLTGSGRRHCRPGVYRQHLKANNLVEVERIMDISARLVVNQAALKLKQQAHCARRSTGLRQQ